MARKQRRKHSPVFESKVALAALKGDNMHSKTVAAVLRLFPTGSNKYIHDFAP